MATFLWSSLVNGQNVAFDANTDLLRFDDQTISAASVQVRGNAASTQFAYSGKTITLSMSWYSITADSGGVIGNINFANGSLLLVGDNTTGTVNDDLPNTLIGGSGNDQLIGFGGNDTLSADSGDDVFLMAGAASNGVIGTDTLVGGPGEDRVIFGVDATSAAVGTNPVFAFDVERIIGTVRDDTFNTAGSLFSGFIFEGAAGNDVFVPNPNSGIETSLSYESAGTGVSINLGTGTASDGLGGTDSFSNIDGIAGSRFNDVLTGGSNSRNAAGTLFEFFQGMAGNDIINGGGGGSVADPDIDRVDYTYSLSGAVVDLTLGIAQDGWGSTDTLINIEWARGSAFDDTLIGNAGDNRLEGLAGNDVLIHTGGVDVLDGGSGIDTADFSRFDSAVWVSLTYPGVEGWTMDRATLTGGTWRQIADLLNIENIVGTVHSDQLFGDNADNVFTYTAGFDTYDGLGGTDTADFSRFASALWIDLTYSGTEVWTKDRAALSGGIWREIADLTNIENLVSTAGSDQLSGDANNNVFSYIGGFDVFDGRGATDTADFSAFGSAVWISLAYPGTEVWTKDLPTLSGGTWREIADLTSIENLIGTGNEDYLSGDAGSNRIVAGGGNDVLAYTGGFDVLDGGSATDTADFSGFGSAVWVSLSYAGTEGWTMDLPTVTGGTWREIADLANVENLIGTAYSDNLIGDAGNNVLSYRGGFDVLDGRGGTDTADFSGFGSGVWVDLIYSGVEGWTKDLPTLTGGSWRAIADLSNVENLVGTSKDDYLSGNASANRLEGGAGNDTFIGHGGNDILIGGAGADRFQYTSVSDAGDTIIDFATGAAGDVLDVRDVLVGYNPGVSSISNFIQLSASGADTVINVNADGVGIDFVALTALQGVSLTGTLLNDLLAQGNLVVN